MNINLVSAIAEYSSAKVEATCPECGTNTVHVDTSMLLTSNPPKYSGSCSSCRKGFYFDAAEINYNLSPFPGIKRDLKLLEDYNRSLQEQIEETSKALQQQLYRLQDYQEQINSHLNQMENTIQEIKSDILVLKEINNG
jgi:hypothetical protein